MSAAISNNAGPASVPFTSVVVVYDEPARAHQAKRFFKGLSERFNGKLEFALRFWPIETILLPGARSFSRTEASGARFVAVAMAAEQIASNVLDWLRSCCLAGRGQNATLIALDSERTEGVPGEHQLTKALRTYAQKEGLDYVSADQLGPRLVAEGFESGLLQRELIVTAALRSNLEADNRSGYRHWGLNE